MTATVSEQMGRAYGAERVCRIFEHPRSTFYLSRHLKRTPETQKPSPSKRGPKTPLLDNELLEAIRAVLHTSPLHVERHRKARARLKVPRGIRVANKPVVRLNRVRAGHRLKEGTRYEALQPVWMGAQNSFRSLGPNVARGPMLRMSTPVFQSGVQMAGRI